MYNSVHVSHCAEFVIEQEHLGKIIIMGDATKEAFELNEEGPVDSQEPLTAGYVNEKEDYIRDPGKDKKKVLLSHRP